MLKSATQKFWAVTMPVENITLTTLKMKSITESRNQIDFVENILEKNFRQSIFETNGRMRNFKFLFLNFFLQY